MKKYIASIIILLGLLSSKTFGLDIINDLNTAVESARKLEKNVLVIFTLENCDFCDVLKKDINTLTNIDNYVICILNSRENKRLTGSMKIKKWPTSIVISIGKEGYGETSRLVGYGNKIEYDNWLKINAEFFGADNACGCDCSDDCPCRKNGICTCCKNTCDCCECNCGKDCECKKNGKCSCKSGACKCKK